MRFTCNPSPRPERSGKYPPMAGAKWYGRAMAASSSFGKNSVQFS